MTPQLVDLNADGMNDMVMATFEGTVFCVEGSEEGFRDPKHIVDREGENVRISMYWDNDAEDYLYVDRSAEDEKYLKEHHLTSSAVVDWDEDGDLDLLLGAYEGALYLCLNEGTKSEPQFSTKNLQVKAGGKHLTIPEGLATPKVVDWNGDGLFDILCGGSYGGVFYYQNIGKKGDPEFASSVSLIDPFKGDSGESGGYGMALAPQKDGLPTCPVKSFHIDAVDYDGDGDLDLLVGAQSYCAAEERKLSDEEKEELKEISNEIDELNEKMEEMFEGKEDSEELKKLYESKEFQEIQEKMMPLWERSSELKPGPKEKNLVWLYRNRGTEGKAVPAESTEDSNSTNDEMASASKSGFEPEKLSLSADLLKTGEVATLSVSIHVPDGFHIYGAKNESGPTNLVISDPGGLQANSPASIPAGRMVMSSGKPSYWLENEVTLEQEFAVPCGINEAVVEGYVNLTMCDKSKCQPPKRMKFTAKLTSSD